MRNRAGLAFETLPEFRTLRKMFGENLNCDVTVEPRIPGAVNLPHSPGTQWGKNFIRPELRSRGQSHSVCDIIVVVRSTIYANGDVTTLRFCFAFSEHFECYGDVTPM